MSSPGTLHALRTRIASLLAESPESAREREQTSFARLFEKSRGGVVLFGAGRLGMLCARALRRGGVPLAAFCDGNPSLVGSSLDGVPILSAEDASARFGGDALFCISIWTGSARESMCQRIRYLRDLGCRHVAGYPALVWAHGREETPFHSFDLPSRMLKNRTEFLALADLLADERSLRFLEATLRQRLLGEFSPGVPEGSQYFPAGIIELDSGESIVDAGAFSGDTLLDVVRRTRGSFARYFAFEPDPDNAARLRKTVGQLGPGPRSHVVIHEIGLHAKSAQVAFACGQGVSSRIVDGGGSTITVSTLDSVLAGEAITFLKFDIEGAEFDALKGSEATLRRCRPRVAVCVYHEPDDLWRIPKLLRKLLPGHRFHLRQHGWDGWELVFYGTNHSS